MLTTNPSTEPHPHVSPDLGEIKGAALAETIRWYQSVYGPVDQVGDVVSMPGHLRPYLDPSRPRAGVLPSRWYPMELAHVLLDRMADRHGRDEMDALALAAGPVIFRSLMGGVQRAVFRLLLNPTRYVAHAQRVFDHNFRGGRLVARVQGSREHMSYVEDFPGHHPFICRVLSSGAGALYGEMGCRGVSSELVECVDDGGHACVTRLTWQA